MIRAGVAAAIALAAFVGAGPGAAEAAPKTHRIGYLLARGPDARIDEAFFRGLNELGYVEGRNIVIEQRFAHGSFERLPQLVQELVGLRVDVIVAAPFPAAQAAKRGTSTVPIVMLAGGDPVAAGLVASLARPGGNVTGVSNEAGDVMPKMLELLREIVPAARRIAVLHNPGNPMHVPFREQLDAAARSLGVHLIYAPAGDAAAFEGAIREAVGQGAAGLIVPQDPVFFNQRGRLIEVATRARLPMMAPFREFAQAGGLASYGRNLAEAFRRMATYVDKILRGADPGALPVELPTTFELVVNLDAARTLGLRISPSLLLRADEVITK